MKDSEPTQTIRTARVIRGIVKCFLVILTGINLIFAFFEIFGLVFLLASFNPKILQGFPLLQWIVYLCFVSIECLTFLSIPYGIGYTWEYFSQQKYGKAVLYGLLPFASLFALSVIADSLSR